jgi:hypothetical protein
MVACGDSGEALKTARQCHRTFLESYALNLAEIPRPAPSLQGLELKTTTLLFAREPSHASD